MTVLRYTKGDELESVAVTWYEPDGTLYDFTSGWTFTARIGIPGSGALVEKTTGFTGAATAPNLTWAPAVGDLALIPAGTYHLDITARLAASTLDVTNTWLIQILDGVLVPGADGATFIASDTLDSVRLESVGAAIDQTVARTERDRWMALIRDSGSPTPSQTTFHYIGGDVCDAERKTDGAVFWICADYFANTAAQDALNNDDTYIINPLSGLRRNGAIFEATPGGTFGGQVHRAGTSGVWMDAVLDGGQAAGRIWWPLSILEGGTANIMHVACWLTDTAPTTPHGTIEDSQIVTLNVFGTYASVLDCNLPPETFVIQCMRKDATHVYILGGQFVPDFDTPVGSGLPNYAIGTLDELREHHMLSRLARVPIANFLTMASWEFWDGTAWVSGATNAVPLKDTAGFTIKGAAGITKTAAGHWLLVARKVADTHVDVYSSDTPIGPWRQHARVPVPAVGGVVGGGVTAAWHTKIIEHLTVPAEHSICSMTMTLLSPTAPLAGMNFRRWTPEFVVVPWY